MINYGEHLIKALAFGCAVLWSLPTLSGQAVDFGSAGKPAPTQRGNPGLVVTSGAAFLAAPVDGATQLPDAPAFRTPVDYFRQDNNNFLLVRIADGKDHWGWMRSADVIGWQHVAGSPRGVQGTYCLRVSDANPIFQKVTLRNDWRTGPAANGGRQPLPETIEFHDAPGGKGAGIRSTRISEIFYVFARAEVGGKGFLLLGADPLWAPERPDASIKGWVAENECTRWNSRVATYPEQAHREERYQNGDLMRLFRDGEHAADYDRTGKVDPGSLLAQETRSSRLLRYDDNRYPVIDQKNNLLKIAFIAGDARKIAEIKEDMYQLRRIQILFVIDATLSMQPYFDAVQQAIRESRDTMSPSVRSQYHFAAAIYRDYPDGAEAAQVIADFDDEKSLSRLSSVVAQSNRLDHDYPEAVYGGIIHAVRSVKWNPAYLKAVVVIGDHGNHPTQKEASRLELGDAIESKPEMTAQAVADALDAPNAIMFHAINVNVRKDWKRYNDLFLMQMDEILDHTKHGARDSQQIHGMGSVARLGIDDPSDANRAKQQIKKAIADAFAATNRAADLLTKIMDTGSCGTELVASPENVFMGPQACAFLMDQIEKAGWGNADKGLTQISEEGWVLAERNKKRLMEPWVWMSRNELFTFTGFLSGVITAINQPEKAAAILAQTARSATGDDILKDESLADYLRRAFQVPFRNDTILRYTTEELQTKVLNDSTFKEEFAKEIGRSFERLSLAQAEQKADVQMTWDPAKRRWIKPPIDQIPAEKRWAASLGTEEYGWIPLTYLPGGLDENAAEGTKSRN